MVRLQINAQKLVLISSWVARVHVSICDWHVSYVLHDWFNSYVCDGWTQACRKLAKSTDSSERAVQTWKPFSWKVIEGQNVFINLPWRTILDFPMYSNLCRCTAHYRLFKLQQVITMNRETAGNHVPFQRLTYLLSQEQQNQTTGQLCVVYHHFICLTTRPASHVAYWNFTLTGPLTLRSRFSLSWPMTCVWPVNICFQSGLTINCIRNYPIKNAGIYPCDSVEFEHNTYCAQICRPCFLL